MRLTCFSIDLGGIKGRIKPEGFTVNDYLAAALFLAIALGVQSKRARRMFPSPFRSICARFSAPLHSAIFHTMSMCASLW